ncbi:MAG: PilN domain-containing protein [Acidobacteria bacterium]|nr:PilN domain-containing protein [Acidobacteriota bacterium]
MIKVNLFHDKTQQVRKTTAQPAASRTSFLLVAVFLLPLAALGAWWYQIRSDIGGLTGARDHLKTQEARLQGLKKEIAKYDELKKQFQSRIDVIERLKDSQSGPVLLMNHVIRSMPRGSPLWLTAMDQKGDKIQITGMTQRSDVLPDLIANLGSSGFFGTVDLEIIEEPKDLAKFILTCTISQKNTAE